MTATYQLLGAVAIAAGLAGTWLAARHRGGWMVCIGSSTLWLPALVTGAQWVAVVNCGLSIAICARNFVAHEEHARPGRSDGQHSTAVGADYPAAAEATSSARP